MMLQQASISGNPVSANEMTKRGRTVQFHEMSIAPVENFASLAKTRITQ
jgi:hypothetical protein